jgi:excisionase family DNA binding protein
VSKRTRQLKPRQPGDDYTIPEAARALRVSKSHLYEAIMSGRCGSVKHGRHRTVTQAQLDEYRHSLEIPRTSFPEYRRIA